MSSVDKLKTLLNKEGKEYKTYKEFHQDYPKDAKIEEEALTHLGKIPKPKVISDLALEKITRLTGAKPEDIMNWGIRYSEDFAHKHKAINKLKALLNKKRNKPRMTYPKIGDNVWDSKQNKWVIEDKQGKGTNILEYKKAIDKLKALLNKEGETNGGEKSQKTEDQKKESQEGKTANNYDNREYEKKETPMYPRIIREFPPDKDDKDPYN